VGSMAAVRPLPDTSVAEADAAKYGEIPFSLKLSHLEVDLRGMPTAEQPIGKARARPLRPPGWYPNGTKMRRCE